VQSYLLNGETKSLLIDTGMGFQNIQIAIKSIAKVPTTVVNTHWHFDHIGGNALFDHIGIAECETKLIERSLTNEELFSILGLGFDDTLILPKGFIPENYQIDGIKATFAIKDGDVINIGNRVIEAIATPGHTRGSTSFLDHHSRSLFTGLVSQDSFYAHFEESDVKSYIYSLEKVISRGDEFDKLLPIHGPYPLPKSFLNEVLSAFIKIDTGAKPDTIDDSWGIECYLYRFSTFNILIKPPGARGISVIPN
jgi:glyoxylase-like metal-dependent hydrolase (beta-lactamase superfamily II)